MSNSNLVDYILISPHKESRSPYQITDITIHHMAGHLTVEECGRVFQTREASSNYGIDYIGKIALYVPEDMASWANANSASNKRSITIELSNSETGGSWPVSDLTLTRCIQLCADICHRNKGIGRLRFTGDTSGNLTMHKYFYPTSCPGPYLEKKFGYIQEEVNKRLAGGWIYELDQWHYYEDGEIVKSAWRKDRTGWCYLNKEGNIVKSAWVKSKNKWYYCGSDGYMVTNKWQKDGTGQWCYLGPDGAQVKDKWLIYRSNIYYIKPDGYMATGEHEIKCSFDESGKLRK